MPKVTPGPGQAVESTTVTRLVDASTVEKEKYSSDALEYMDLIPRDKWDQGNHAAYIYRVEPPVYRNASGPAYVTKYATPITLDQIQREYGGGLWRILVKRGDERMADRNYQVTGTPRDLTRSTQEFAPAAPSGVPAGDSVSLASQAMNLAANPTAQAHQMEMMRASASAAIDLVKANAPKQLSVQEILELAKGLNGTASSEKPFLETEVGKILIAAAGALVTALVNRLVSPADPLDQLSKYAEVIGKFSPAASTNDWKAALVQAAPQLAMSIKDTVQELRLGTEAQMRMNAGRTLTAAPPPPPSAAPAVQPNPGPQNVVEMPAPQTQSGAQPMEPFEMKLVELLNDPQMTAEKAGEELDKQWPRIIDEVSKYSVDQILQAFQIRPILQPHAQNPRLRQFVTELLEWANETDTPPLTPNPPAS
jgi:hypothetical protein